MAINNFNGQTFVAFLDISGFKEFMKEENKAVEVLDKFYRAGFDVLSRSTRVEGLFVSDCGILFIRHQDDINVQLQAILSTVKSLNENMLQHDVMLTTSIAYGDFFYQNRMEISGSGKNFIYGEAYVKAYFDNENGKPKIQPGECRLLKSGHLINPDNNLLLLDKGKYLYYYWNVQNPEDIGEFRELYNNSYKRKYTGMLEALKKFNVNQ
jgi:hypothetical protein